MTDAAIPPNAGAPALPPGAGRAAARAVPPPPSRFASYVPPRWFPVAAGAVGVAAAALLVDNKPGLAVPLVVAAAAAAVLPAVRVRRWDWPLALVGGGLALMPALRDAEWLVALDLLAIVALGCLVVVGVPEFRSVLLAAVSVPARIFPAPAFLARGLPTSRDFGPWLRGTAIGGALVLVFGALFASADAAFGSLVESALPDAGLLPARAFMAVFVTLLLAAAVLANRAPVALPETTPRRLRGAEWLVPLVALDLLFAAFVAVQLTVLFGGADHVLRTAGLTYAEYAVSGFYQLITVCALTFAVVAGAVRWAPAGRPLRGLLGLLLALDAVVLVSALRRLALYESAYGLSIQRVLAHTIALWLGLVLVLVVAAGLTRRSAWLPRAVVGSCAGTLLLLNVLNPEAMVARDLVDRYERTGKVDEFYLADLSADAIPQIARLPLPLRTCVLSFTEIEDDSWAETNRSRARAREVLRDVPPTLYTLPHCAD
ncbi:MAG TPA: DUF4173 domain-containing protein [Frankiaceae bacterium]|nr:DUF4173 domain-containing protein [Frankiaceae bacterium]